ncbi:cytochrome P450 monooxygenase [Aspergillus bertholletiae]|uniref:Cytochrome P450 monooxygenase n=1 Tax=Aspergillus bertholletiae TaxID=1226010 RepID=A0A5N7BI11_9EURO|nr:cytochrome P450 monooxygenase [Aspergillus bertholletiae]
MDTQILLTPSVVVILLLVFIYYRIWYHRFKQYSFWPQPPVSLLWGHWNVMHKAIQACPAGASSDIAFGRIWETLGRPPAFILDLRPVGSVLCVVCNHEMAEQSAQPSKKFPYGLGKPPVMKTMSALIGRGSIITSNGLEWKNLRRRYTQAFALPHLIRLLPVILDKVGNFLQNIEEYAVSSEEFRLGDICNRVTYDIISKIMAPRYVAHRALRSPSLDAVLLGESSDNIADQLRQREIFRIYHQLVATYRNTEEESFLIDPRVKWRRRRMATQLDVLIQEAIKYRFSHSRSRVANHTIEGNLDGVILMSLVGVEELTQEILNSTCDQVKTFLFAGHDTTSTLLQWALYELSRTPRVLHSLRTELDEVLGHDTGTEVLYNCLTTQGASIFGKMPYLSAIIKETLRLHPPGATARMAVTGSGVFLQFPDGRTLCVDDFVVYNCLSIIHRDGDVYGESSNDFIPERWLCKKNTSALPASTWRPFERGPRSCLGQELANIEARVILACAARKYDFFKVGLGETMVDASGAPILHENGQYRAVEDVYNTRELTFKPIDGMRMTVQPALALDH